MMYKNKIDKLGAFSEIELTLHAAHRHSIGI